MADCDALSVRYTGASYPRQANQALVTVIVAIERWHTWRFDD
jgi:hypothetical protein